MLLGDLPGIEGVLGVLVQKRGLAHPRVAEGQEFDQVVIVHRGNNVIRKSLSLLLSPARIVLKSNVLSLLNRCCVLNIDWFI